MLALIIFCLIYPKLKYLAPILRFKRRYNLVYHAKYYNQLFKTTKGFHLSKVARKKNDSIEYTYGEIDFTSFIALIAITKPSNKTVFYDLGSGIGTAAIACAMVFPVKKSIGIECLELLYRESIQQKQRLIQLPQYKLLDNKLYFFHQNFIEANLNTATLIFINATALFGNLWQELQKKLLDVNKEAIIITTSKQLPKNLFILLYKTKIQMSFGVVDAYLQRIDPAINPCNNTAIYTPS